MQPSEPTRIVAESVVQRPSQLGEGAIWDDRAGQLYWVDILGEQLLRFDPRTSTNVVFALGQSVGSVVLDEVDRCILALRDGFACFDLKTQQLRAIGEPKLDEPGNRFNDGKCDPRGRFWAGTMAAPGKPGSGNLYCLDLDLTMSRKLEAVTISNGLCWSRKGNAFFYIDTPTHELVVFDYDADKGALSGRRVLRHFEPELGSPDGMAIDAEDHLWVALWGGGKVQRVHPRSGEVDFEVLVPATQVTSCAFGGPELQDLYITTARVGLSDLALASRPHSGSLFHAKVPYRGVPATRFGGLA